MLFKPNATSVFKTQKEIVTKLLQVENKNIYVSANNLDYFPFQGA